MRTSVLLAFVAWQGAGRRAVSGGWQAQGSAHAKLDSSRIGAYTASVPLESRSSSGERAEVYPSFKTLALLLLAPVHACGFRLSPAQITASRAWSTVSPLGPAWSRLCAAKRRGGSSVAQLGLFDDDDMIEYDDMRESQAANKPDREPVNDEIPHDTLRVMVDEGGGEQRMIGVMSKSEALDECERMGTEYGLVIISSKQDPVLTLITPLSLYLYKKKKEMKEQKAKERKLGKTKELRLSYDIGPGDFETRRKRAWKFLCSGERVKFSITFRGRQGQYMEKGKEVMKRLAAELELIGRPDGKPSGDAKSLTMYISPIAKADRDIVLEKLKNSDAGTKKKR